MKFIKAKKILSSWSNGGSWFGVNYGMNIYKGCNHGCIYCDSRSDCYGVDNFDEVRAKEDILLLLANELKTKRKKGIVGTGAMSDAYNTFEEKYKLTRESLKLLDRYGFGASVLTKSDLITRDIDLFKRIKSHSPMMVKFTITTYDDTLCSKIEPNVAVTSKRFAALNEISKESIFTGVHIWPILPFINDTEKNIRTIVKEAAKNGADFVIPYFGVTLRQNQKLYFYKQLDSLFPGLKQKYIETYNNSYECNSMNRKKLWEVLVEECNKYGLLYKMKDIRKALKSKYNTEQMSLF